MRVLKLEAALQPERMTKICINTQKQARTRLNAIGKQLVRLNTRVLDLQTVAVFRKPTSVSID